MKQFIKKLGGCCAGMLITWCLNAQSTLTRVEYYLDKDPGYGKATAINVSPGTNLSNTSFNFDPTALSSGVHVVGIRAKDANNAWSQDNKFVFAKPYPAGESTGATPNISHVEYYVDNDPGYGKATAVSFTAGANLSDISIQIDPAALSSGVHVVGIRAKDASNAWSQDNKFVFARPYPAGESTGATPNLVRVEYYVDTDPGYGKATAVSFTAGTSLSDIAVNLDPAILESGVHIFGLRSKDANGAWSQDNKFVFAKPYPAGENAGSRPDLASIEYYIDKDPGYGKGIPVAINDATNLSNINLAVNITGLSIDTHHLYIRSKDTRKAWSLDNEFEFEVKNSAAMPSIVLNSVSRKTVCPPDTLKIAYQAKGTFTAGNIFKVQMSNASGSFASPVVVGSYTGTVNSIITCVIPAGLPASSRYKLRIVSTNPIVTGITSYDSVTIRTTHPAPTITPAGTINLCAGNNITLTSSSGFSSYLWNNGQAESQISVSAAGNYNVRVTDSYGCKATSLTDTVKIVHVPDTTSKINGPITIVPFQSNITYSVTAIAGHTYTWTVPAGDTITAGQGTASIKVKWGANSGNVSVVASNSCGTSPARQLFVTVAGTIAAGRPSPSLKDEIGLYPNPTSNAATMLFAAAKTDKYFIEITDITGKVLLVKSGTSFPGTNRVALDIGKFSNGIYIVNLKDKQHIIKSMKLIKRGF